MWRLRARHGLDSSDIVLCCLLAVCLVAYGAVVLIQRARDAERSALAQFTRIGEIEFRGIVRERTELVFAGSKDALTEAREASARRLPVVLRVRVAYGKVVQIETIETPIPSLDRLIRSKVATWGFYAYASGVDRRRVRSQLTFYVDVEAGGVVLRDPLLPSPDLF